MLSASLCFSTRLLCASTGLTRFPERTGRHESAPRLSALLASSSTRSSNVTFSDRDPYHHDLRAFSHGTEAAISVVSSANLVPFFSSLFLLDQAFFFYLELLHLCIFSIASTLVQRKADELVSVVNHPALSESLFPRRHLLHKTVLGPPRFSL